MRTDWALVRRLAFELQSQLLGARVQDAGAAPDGRPAIALWSAGGTRTLCMDLFGSPPLVTLDAELDIDDPPGFPRSLARVLRGSTLAGVRSGDHDRLLHLSFHTRSRFGITNEVDLYIELVPRFGNAVLVKNETVVAACKEFDPAHSARATMTGFPYVQPPRQPVMLPLIVADAGHASEQALAFLESDEALHEPLFVYRCRGMLLQAHLLPLDQFSDATLTREPSLLSIMFEERARRTLSAASAADAGRRRALQRRIDARMRRVDAALLSLDARQLEIAQRHELRREGEALYARLHELAAPEREEAKQHAADVFARYRKLGTALPHLESRRLVLRAQREWLETLLWEVERVDTGELADTERAIDAIGVRRSSPKPSRPRAGRKRLEYRTANGSRILVGRSPAENAELTFRVAKSNDLWFHARAVPGAHVILIRDDRDAPPDEDVAAAAALAASHSKARESLRVTVDYTQRKHVHKQPEAPPGLVFYTKARSIAVTPSSATAGATRTRSS